MCLCICVTLADFFTLKKNYADPVSVYVMLYVINLIQILIIYNVKNLITAACTSSLDFDLKIEKSPYVTFPSSGGSTGRGG